MNPHSSKIQRIQQASRRWLQAFVQTIAMVVATLGVNEAQESPQTIGNQLIVYPAPAGVKLNEDFSVKVRNPGGEWCSLSIYSMKVDKIEGLKHQPVETSVASFDFAGEAEVELRSLRGPIHTARVRPLSHGIPFECNGDTLRFTLRRALKLSIEINGQLISDDMKKPGWYKTGDMAGIYIGEHVDGVRFIVSKKPIEDRKASRIQTP